MQSAAARGILVRTTAHAQSQAAIASHAGGLPPSCQVARGHVAPRGNVRRIGACVRACVCVRLISALDQAGAWSVAGMPAADHAHRPATWRGLCGWLGATQPWRGRKRACHASLGPCTVFQS